MTNRKRQNELKVYLNDDEQYILEQKWKLSNMKSKSAFIRHMILYGYVYDVDYEYLREYNTLRSKGADEKSMAVTKIHAVKATVHKTITYICNPEKTDGNILISSFGCGTETAAYDLKFSLSKTKQSDQNLAFHLIQVFMSGEVSYEEAHQIGTELADKLLEGKHSYIVATHIDKNHIHNPILFCAANNIEYTKYHHCKSSYYHIRHLSDELCKEHQLSVAKLIH